MSSSAGIASIYCVEQMVNRKLVVSFSNSLSDLTSIYYLKTEWQGEAQASDHCGAVRSHSIKYCVSSLALVLPCLVS